jgi:hypothetical protein
MMGDDLQLMFDRRPILLLPKSLPSGGPSLSSGTKKKTKNRPTRLTYEDVLKSLRVHIQNMPYRTSYSCARILRLSAKGKPSEVRPTGFSMVLYHTLDGYNHKTHKVGTKVLLVSPLLHLGYYWKSDNGGQSTTIAASGTLETRSRVPSKVSSK